MKNGIYEVDRYKLVRNNTSIDITLSNVKNGYNHVIMIPWSTSEEENIKESKYMVYLKFRSAVVTKFCKTIDEAEKEFVAIQSYYAQGVTM